MRPKLRCVHFTDCNACTTNDRSGIACLKLRCAHFTSCCACVTGMRESTKAGLCTMCALLAAILASALVKCAHHKYQFCYPSGMCALRARQVEMCNVDRKSMVFWLKPSHGHCSL